LEKIEMKKTLVAVAALAAVAGAHAEATLYGTIDQHLISQKAGTTTTVGIGGSYSGNALGVKGSEDLGSGVKANFQVELLPTWSVAPASTLGGTATAGSLGNYQSFVGLSGAELGSIRVGQFFNSQFFNNAMGDATGRSNAGGYSVASETYTGVNQTNAVEYTLPTFVTGLGVIYTRTFDNGATTSATTGIVASSTYRITYSLGGFNVGYAASDAAATSGAAMNKHSTSISANYDFGAAKVFVNSQTATTSDTAYNYGVSIPVGAFSLNLNSGSSKISGTTTNAYIVQGTYALSKRTLGLIQYSSVGTTATSAIGVQHNF